MTEPARTSLSSSDDLPPYPVCCGGGETAPSRTKKNNKKKKNSKKNEKCTETPEQALQRCTLAMHAARAQHLFWSPKIWQLTCWPLLIRDRAQYRPFSDVPSILTRYAKGIAWALQRDATALTAGLAACDEMAAIVAAHPPGRFGFDTDLYRRQRAGIAHALELLGVCRPSGRGLEYCVPPPLLAGGVYGTGRPREGPVERPEGWRTPPELEDEGRV